MYKEYMNSMGLYYSGDKTKYGLNYSLKSYDIWHNQWRHYSGISGNDFDTLKNHIEQNKNLTQWNTHHG